MTSERAFRATGIVIVGVCGLSLWTLGAGPSPSGSTAPGQEAAPEWREKFQMELRDHPRLARSIIALHETRDYLEKAPNTFGGHKAAAIASCDAAIQELKNALQFDIKEIPRASPNAASAPASGSTGGPGAGVNK